MATADWSKKTSDMPMEAVNSADKTELVRGPAQGPWKTIEDLELATPGRVHPHNTERSPGYLGHVLPLEYECTAISTTDRLVGNKK